MRSSVHTPSIPGGRSVALPCSRPTAAEFVPGGHPIALRCSRAAAAAFSPKLLYAPRTSRTRVSAHPLLALQLALATPHRGDGRC